MVSMSVVRLWWVGGDCMPHIECAKVDSSHLIQYKLIIYFSLDVGCLDFSQHFDLKRDLAIKLLFIDSCK